MSSSKNVRRDEADWPSEQETNSQLLELFFNGKSPFDKWEPSTNLDQAVKIAQDAAWKRGWNFELHWVSYAARVVIDEWEARLSYFNIEAAARRDLDKAGERWWAAAKTPSMAICRMLLNFFDGVPEDEYATE